MWFCALQNYEWGDSSAPYQRSPKQLSEPGSSSPLLHLIHSCIELKTPEAEKSSQISDNQRFFYLIDLKSFLGYISKPGDMWLWPLSLSV